jgi:putative alpha-1,2-mannosidase
MNNILAFLKGKKTYITVAAGILTLIALKLGYVSADTAQTLFVFEGFSGLAALRAAVANEVNSALDQLEVVPNAPTPVTPPTV